jgi:hypothetical protein
MQTWREVMLQWLVVVMVVVMYYYIYLAGTRSNLLKPLF